MWPRGKRCTNAVFTARMSTPSEIIGGAVKHLLDRPARNVTDPGFMKEMSETHEYTRKVLLAAKAHIKEDDPQVEEKKRKVDETLAQLDYEFLLFILCAKGEITGKEAVLKLGEIKPSSK